MRSWLYETIARYTLIELGRGRCNAKSKFSSEAAVPLNTCRVTGNARVRTSARINPRKAWAAADSS